VRRELPEAGFVLFGDGPERGAIERAIAQHGLEGRFILAGFRTDVPTFLPSLDIGVLPSFTEGLPVAVLETMAAGVPVVATAVGGTPEVVLDGVTGCLVPAGDPAAMARRIIELLPDEGLRRRMGQEGRQLVEEQFTFETQSAAYLRLFGRLTQNRQATSLENRHALA
jgi:glycosyltransferase involved in cell wall biosynthesis